MFDLVQMTCSYKVVYDTFKKKKNQAGYTNRNFLGLCWGSICKCDEIAVQKQYIAEVVGVFPEQVVDVNVNYDAKEGRSNVEVGDGSMNMQLKGKVACMKFKGIKTNGDYSIVLCEPVTGRSHQIRVHLQYSGHPIANDMLYLGEKVGWRSTEGTSADRATARWRRDFPPKISENIEDPEEESFTDFINDPMCTHCPNLGPNGYDEQEEGLWLHCVRYIGPDWSYDCPYPDWVKLDDSLSAFLDHQTY